MSANNSITVTRSAQIPQVPANTPLTRYVDFSINNPGGDIKKGEFQHTYNGDVLPKADDYIVAPLKFEIESCRLCY